MDGRIWTRRARPTGLKPAPAQGAVQLRAAFRQQVGMTQVPGDIRPVVNRFPAPHRTQTAGSCPSQIGVAAPQIKRFSALAKTCVKLFTGRLDTHLSSDVDSGVWKVCRTMLERCLSFVDRWLGYLGPREWLIVAVVGLALGALWLRGFGSRSDY